MRKPQYGGPWRTVRKEVLARDNYICQIGAPGCTVTAQEADHIVPISKGGEWWAPSNLRASCRACNNGRNKIRRTKGSREW